MFRCLVFTFSLYYDMAYESPSIEVTEYCRLSFRRLYDVCFYTVKYNFFDLDLSIFDNDDIEHVDSI